MGTRSTTESEKLRTQKEILVLLQDTATDTDTWQ